MSEELKRDMIHIPEDPETIQAFVTAMQRLDNRCRDFQQESRSYSRPAAPNPPTTTTQYRAAISPPATITTTPRGSTATGTQPGPMDLLSNRCRLTPEEKQRRIAEGRCRYCGGLGHMAANCPVAPRPLRAAQGFVAPNVQQRFDPGRCICSQNNPNQIL